MNIWTYLNWSSELKVSSCTGVFGLLFSVHDDLPHHMVSSIFSSSCHPGRKWCCLPGVSSPSPSSSSPGSASPHSSPTCYQRNPGLLNSSLFDNNLIVSQELAHHLAIKPALKVFLTSKQLVVRLPAGSARHPAALLLRLLLPLLLFPAPKHVHIPGIAASSSFSSFSTFSFSSFSTSSSSLLPSLSSSRCRRLSRRRQRGDCRNSRRSWPSGRLSWWWW